MNTKAEIFEYAKFCHRIDILRFYIMDRYSIYTLKQKRDKLFDIMIKKYSSFNNIQLFNDKGELTNEYKRYSTAYNLFRLYHKDSEFYSDPTIFKKFVW